MPAPTTPLSRQQRLWLAGVLTVAAGLRFVGIANLSLSHMDEGGYVSSAMTVATGGLYSFPFSQALQSPPLLPWLVGGVVWLTQAQWPIFGVLITAAFGVGGVQMQFLLGRRWGGNQFGLWGATLLAVSDFHIAYSRIVLTDVLLTFWFLLTLYCVTLIWEQTNWDSPKSGGERKDEKKQNPRRPVAAPSVPHWLVMIGWSIATGISAGAAWNTKYNGWLVLAIAATATGLWGARERFWDPSPLAGRRLTRSEMLLCGLLVAAIIAAISYLPWFLFVERSFPGGYAAITANHRRYFGSPADWPGHAYRLIASLAALRHFGWIATLGLVGRFGWMILAQRKSATRAESRTLPKALAILFVLGLATLVSIQGGDAALLLLGTVGILPSLGTKNWPRLLAAVWCGTFVVLTPLYHPYPRLMLPSLPAAIFLALWLLEDAWPGLINRSDAPPVTSEAASRRQLFISTGLFSATAALSLLWLLGPHPFGLAIPKPGIWNRWTARHSYRAAGEAIREHSDADAFVLCQTQLAMVVYSPRPPLVAEDHSFRDLLNGFPKDRSCYLVVDFSWIHNPRNKEALQGILDHTEDLTPVAVIPNDLCIVTLLDFLTPEEAAAKLASEWPLYGVGADQQFPVPPSLSAHYQDVIVIYRVRLPNSR